MYQEYMDLLDFILRLSETMQGVFFLFFTASVGIVCGSVVAIVFLICDAMKCRSSK